MRAKAIVDRGSVVACNVRGAHRAVCLRVSGAAKQRSISTVTVYQRDPELQAALDALFADTVEVGRTRLPTAEVAHHIERITNIGRSLGLNVVRSEWSNGAFRGLVTTNVSGISEDSVTSLARLTFGKVAPGTLEVQTGKAVAAGVPDAVDEYKGTLAQVAGAPDRGYTLVNYFQVVSNGVLGKMMLKGIFDKDEQDPSRLDITFLGFTLEPALPNERSLALWREALGEHNPGMGPTGAIDVQLPDGRFRNHLCYIVMEPDLNMFITGSGALYVMKRAHVQA